MNAWQRILEHRLQYNIPGAKAIASGNRLISALSSVSDTLSLHDLKQEKVFPLHSFTPSATRTINTDKLHEDSGRSSYERALSNKSVQHSMPHQSPEEHEPIRLPSVDTATARISDRCPMTFNG